jgi:hypothetical protein
MLVAWGFAMLFLGVGSHACMAQSAGTFTPTASTTTARSFHTASLIPNGKVLIAGGTRSTALHNPGSILASAELYDPGNGTFSAAGDMTTARALHTATLLPDGRVLLAGGDGPGSAELYDPSTGTFTATGKMITNRAAHTAILLRNGRVLLVGGFANLELPFQPFGAELYDPATGLFTSVALKEAAPRRLADCRRCIEECRSWC